MGYTVINTNKEQADKLYNKHLKNRILISSFSYDQEDNIGFVTLRNVLGKTISYQLRNGNPMFVSFTGFGNIRYDIAYPEKLNEDMYNLLKKKGNDASKNFWKGGQI